ncbi:MAG: magnesium/cobalt transporter CorA [Sulfurimicrobium sp.]|nr:magnesium/cobalt transporter CorA [Sulfurimicrobium sp.]MDP1705794.1 magnesium/cobalt transporter CorA [Sulfurimicrobium sp.]MDP2199207.1 magnesium/cobalt transporter CorA [Sulfurimicrobium sp.]MDP3689359.1 magnesium/cobalt transporter CorA [Sulfurimicrobium sp.]
MARHALKKRSKKAGFPPGTLMHIGDQITDVMKAVALDYDAQGCGETILSDYAQCMALRGKPTVTWVDIEGVHDIQALEKIGHCFGLHPLVMEDILNTDQRPKIEDYGDYLYIVLRMLTNGSESGEIRSEQVSLILGENFVLSIQEGARGDVFEPVRNRIRNAKGQIRRLGADYLAYSLIDAVVDNYFIILETIGERVELLEETLISDPGPETLHLIHNLKREMIYLRKSVWPLREVVSGMQRRDSTLIREGTGYYLRDVYDHTIQVIDTIETFRDMLSGMLDIYLSSISNRTNAVMKVLTVIATIFIPLTWIVGIYGMNFKNMPELEWHYGYLASWVVMILLASGMVIYFKKKKWW